MVSTIRPVGDEGWRPLRPERPGEQDAALRASPFARLALTHALGVAGDALVTVALAGSLFFDISPSAARGRVILSLVLTIAPFGVVAPFLGPAIDRIRGGRRLTVVLSSVARAVTCFAMAGVIDELLLFPAAFCMLVLSKTYSVAKSSLVPNVVASDDELVEANAKLALVGSVVGVAAALPGIVVLKLADAGWVVRLAALAFIASALLGLRIVQVRVDDPTTTPAAAQELRAAGVRLAAGAMAVLRSTVGFLTFLIAFGLRREDAPAWVFGIVLATSMVATFAGAALAPRLRQRLVEEHLLSGALAAVVVGALVAARIGGRPAATLAAAAVGLSASAGRLAFEALVQRDAPDATQGRSFARFEAGFQLAWVVGALVPVVLTVPPSRGYVLLAMAAAVAGATYLSGLRSVRH